VAQVTTILVGPALLVIPIPAEVVVVLVDPMALAAQVDQVLLY
jgi:hypothetical protein